MNLWLLVIAAWLGLSFLMLGIVRAAAEADRQTAIAFEKMMKERREKEREGRDEDGSENAAEIFGGRSGKHDSFRG